VGVHLKKGDCKKGEATAMEGASTLSLSLSLYYLTDPDIKLYFPFSAVKMVRNPA
jgi:hypothetical protein